MRSTSLLTVLFVLFSGFGQLAAAQTVVPGFGSDERAPTGAPFSLPPGLEIAGPLQGANDDGDCPKPSTATAGSGLWVRACLPVRNRTGGPVTVTLPPGLTIVSASETFQNGVLVERSVVTVPPTINSGPGRLRDKEEEDVVYIPLHMYCINPAKDPSDSTASFRLGPVSAHPGMAEIYDLVEGRDIAGDRDPVEAVQMAIDDIVNDGAISEDSRQFIQDYVLSRERR